TAISTQAASGQAAAGTASNTITFAIPGSGPHTISVGSDASALNLPLPTITHQVFIDGWSQGGTTYKGPPLIVLDGVSVRVNPNGASPDGLALAAGSDGSTVRGLAIERFGSNIDSSGSGSGIVIDGSNNNQIVGNYLGLGADGSLGGNAEGVRIKGGATGNIVGGTTAGAANVISNNFYGVVISAPGTNTRPG